MNEFKRHDSTVPTAVAKSVGEARLLRIAKYSAMTAAAEPTESSCRNQFKLNEPSLLLNHSAVLSLGPYIWTAGEIV